VLRGRKRIKGTAAAVYFGLLVPRNRSFVVINLFDSLKSVNAFAGTEYHTPVLEPEARALAHVPDLYCTAIAAVFDAEPPIETINGTAGPVVASPGIAAFT
jgi:hypothetical protein